MTNTSYRLRCQLYGHEADVRSVSAITEYEGLISGSRDRTARVWRATDQNSFEQRALLKNHTNFVIATCYIPTSGAFPDGLIVTGGNDKKICVHAAKQDALLFTLEGHEQPVSCLFHVPQSDLLLSTSWDCTARVWSLSNRNCTQILRGHSNAVWAIVTIGDATNHTDMILTGGADNVILGWKNQSIAKKYEGHSGCVRSLVVINSKEFLSSSNDITIKRWNIQSTQCTQTFEGHTNFVYSLSMVNADHFASISEDRSLRLWSINQSESIQTIRLPSSTIWSVCTLINGDVAVACSDGRICIFTKDESRVAKMKEISAFEEELASSSIQTKTGDLGNVKIDDLPTEDSLKNPGQRDGQTTMINKGKGHVEAYQWVAADQRWMKIGDVVGSADSAAQGQASVTGEKIMYEGKYYDYVFDVALDEGSAAPLKLPYNINEDPWYAAQAFIHRHDLNQMFLDQIANFIIKNTKGMVIDQRASDYADPFTGSGRYVPSGSSSMGTQGEEKNYDPFTGAGRYDPQSSDRSTSSLSASQSTVSNIKTEEDTLLATSFPKSQYIKMSNADIPKILSKLKEFNSSFTGDGLRLSDDQLEQINQLANGNTNDLENKMKLISQTLKWPVDKIFPIMDIIRLIVLNNDVCRHLLENENRANDFFTELISHLHSDHNTNVMFVFRTFTNLFFNDLGEKYLLKHYQTIIPKSLILLPSSRKNTQLALTTMILNYCIYAYRSNDETLSKYLYKYYSTLVDVQLESDCAKRLLLGLGTLFYTNADLVLNVQTTTDNSAKRFFTTLEKSASQLTPDTLECLEKCRSLLKNL